MRLSTSQTTTWIFDLDNTLHNADPYIFPEMNRQMTEYVARHLGLTADQADRLRHNYWKTYGSTLAGLLHHGNIDPERFLRETHDFPNLARQVLPMTGLKKTIGRINGRKILFTNAPRHYAKAVLRHLGIAHCFEGIVCMQDTHFRPKPHMAGYLHLLRTFGANPRHCTMVEDTRENLLPAKRLRMRTIWLGRHSAKGPFVDRRISRLAALI